MPALHVSTQIRPLSLAYLQALSTSTPSTRSISARTPSMHTPGWQRSSIKTPRSNATASNCSTARCAASDKSTGSRCFSGTSKAPASAASCLASASMSSTRRCILRPSRWMPSIHWRWLCTVSFGCPKAMELSAKITVRGVFSSCEASAMNCRWERHACSAGRSAQRENRTDISRKATSTPTPTNASVAAKDFQPEAEPASANAR